MARSDQQELDDEDFMTTIAKSRFKIVLIFVLAVLISFWLGRMSIPTVATIDMTQKWPSKIRSAMLSLEPWLQNAQAVRLGRYIVYAPKDNNTYKLRIMTDPLKKYIDIDENNISIMFDTAVNDSISITDKDKKSGRRSICYDIYDDNDKVIGNVIDIGRDGQPDFKYMRGDGKEMYVREENKYIFVAGQWRHFTVKEKERGVIIDGEWEKVKFVQSHYELDE
jgi:hypothetical protein